MKKRDIIQLVKETVKENTFYGNREQPSQLSTGTKVSVPTDKYPFSAKPKRTATGMMEFEQPKSFDPDTIRLVRDMLEDADIHHNELVGGYDEVSSYLDKRTGGTIIKIPHFNGPGPGALFGKKTVDQIDRSKAAAKTVAAKLYYKFKTYIEDYEISDKSPAGVYGNIYLWMMFNDLAKDYSAPKGGTQSSQFEENTAPKKENTYNKQTQLEMKVTDKDGNDVTSDIIKKIEKGLEKQGYKFTRGYTSDPDLRKDDPRYTGLKKENEENFIVTNSQGDTDVISADPLTINKLKSDSAISQIKSTKGQKIKEEPNEGNAFAVARLKAIKAGDKKFKVGDKEFDLTDVSDDDKKAAAELDETMYTNDVGKDDYVDDEGRMAKSQMYKTGKYAMKLHDMLDDMEQLPSWVQAKLTKASDYLSAVYHYLDYEFARRDGNLMENMDKHKRRSILMEGATEKLYKLFNLGKSNEEVRNHYLERDIDMPESFVEKLRKNYNDQQELNLTTKQLDQEAENLKPVRSTTSVSGMESGEEGMEEDKQLASGLFKN